jgi:hypothetical protein
LTSKLFLPIFALFAVTVATGFAQDSDADFPGPGILNRGIGDVGSRGGQALNIRLYASADATYETGIFAYGTDAQGNLLKVQPMWGMDFRLGAYGVHRWKHAELGLDYVGGFRHYPDNPFFDGSDHALALGFNYQQSRRLTLQFQESAGTYGRTLGTRVSGPPDNSGITAAGQFLDSRTSYLRSSVDAIIVQSARMYYTVGGAGYLSERHSSGLADIKGYTFTGGVSRRLTQFQTVGAQYSYGRQEIPLFSSEVNTHTLEGTYDAQFGPVWSLSIRGGAFVSEATSISTITLDPILASLFGTNTLALQTYERHTFPSGGVTLRRQFKQASLNFNYNRSAGVGNGLTAAARVENGTAGFSYSASSRWNFGVDGGYYSMKDLLKAAGGSGVFSAGAGLTYALGHAMHLNFRYDARHVTIDAGGNYRPDSSRTSFGLSFSPGEFPLSLW